MLYKEMRELGGVLPTPVRQYLRLVDNTLIARQETTRLHPDWDRFLLETNNETVNILAADPIPPPSLAELAQTALETINWQGWKDRIATGRTAVTALDTDIIGIPSAATRNRFVALFTGLLDAHEATGRMLHDILVALSRTDDNTPL